MPCSSIKILQLSAFGSPLVDYQLCHISPTDLGVTVSHRLGAGCTYVEVTEEHDFTDNQQRQV